jgi:hypothetical protein
MAGKPNTADRLTSRLDRKALHRKSMPGGGEVFTGEVASRSLKALGARAMTVDRSIIVSEDFDPAKPADQALFAHEQFHVEHSGGEGAHHGRDSEEVAARAVERMVLHRATNQYSTSEEYEQSSDVPHDTLGPGAAGPQKAKRNGQEDDSSAAQRGYDAMKAKGIGHLQIVDQLAHEVLRAMDEGRDGKLERLGDKKGWL